MIAHTGSWRLPPSYHHPLPPQLTWGEPAILGRDTPPGSQVRTIGSLGIAVTVVNNIVILPVIVYSKGFLNVFLGSRGSFFGCFLRFVFVWLGPGCGVHLHGWAFLHILAAVYVTGFVALLTFSISSSGYLVLHVVSIFGFKFWTPCFPTSSLC